MTTHSSPKLTTPPTQAEDGATTAPPPRTASRFGEIRPLSRKWRHGWQFLAAALWLMDAGSMAALGATVLPPLAAALCLSGAMALGEYSGARLRRLAGLRRTVLLACLPAAGWALLAVAGLGAATGVQETRWLAATALIAAGVLAGNRLAAALAIAALLKAGHLRNRVVLVGAGESAARILGRLSRGDDPDIVVLGVFDDRRTRVPQRVRGVPVLGNTDDLLTFLRANSVDRVILTLPGTGEERTVLLLKKLQTVPVRIDIVAHAALWGFGGAELPRVAGVPVITVVNRRVDDQIGWVKRAEDLVVATLLLAALAPLMLAVAALVRLDSRGPALFRQKRYGYNNGIFEVYKFRTMHHDPVPDPEVRQARRNDPRVTRIGRFLRRTSLDELPQLLNVIGGSMSIVGPRPHAIPHNQRYGGLIDEYFARHNVKPGITGWAQVQGLRGETDTDDKMRRRVEADLFYIENWSLPLDLRIIALTAWCVWFHDTAH